MGGSIIGTQSGAIQEPERPPEVNRSQYRPPRSTSEQPNRVDFTPV